MRSTVRAAILDGTLPAGSRLVQTELAVELDVSTTPVREALRDLAAEGLIVLDPHRGALVRELKMTEVKEIYELRMVLEPLMVRRVIRNLSDSELARAESLCAQMDKETDPGAWVALNRQFHAVFSAVDEGSRLASILDGLRDSAAGYVAVSMDAAQKRAEANEQHKRLVDFYKQKDEDGAVQLTVEHLRSTLSAIERHPGESVIAPMAVSNLNGNG